jgi:hypothetical protein
VMTSIHFKNAVDLSFLPGAPRPSSPASLKSRT